MRAKGSPGILCAEQAAPLQFGHDEFDEILKRRRVIGEDKGKTSQAPSVIYCCLVSAMRAGVPTRSRCPSEVPRWRAT